MTIIPSEDQAEAVGIERTGGERGSEFEVFFYIQKRTNLTLFMVRIARTNEIIKFM